MKNQKTNWRERCVVLLKNSGETRKGTQRGYNTFTLGGIFAPGIDISDFWYLQQSQAKFRAPYVVPRKKLPAVFADILVQLTAAQ
jgi:hypothetical protein